MLWEINEIIFTPTKRADAESYLNVAGYLPVKMEITPVRVCTLDAISAILIELCIAIM